MLTAKIVAAIVAALGLGFTGTYFATSGDCSGGCPISKLLHGDSSSDCCNPPSDCCSPPSACCGEAKAKTAGFCTDKTEPVSDKKVPDCCFPGSPCCEGGDCCLKK